MGNKKLLKQLSKQVLIATIYIVLSLVFYFLSFELIQFRIAEVLLILVYFNPYNAIGVLIGTMITNAFSPLGLIDVLVGSSATLISIGFMILTRRNKIISLLFPVLFNALFVGLLLESLFQTPFYLGFTGVAIGEAVVLYGIGLPLYYYLIKRDDFVKMLEK